MTVIHYIVDESICFHTYVANCVAFVREDSDPCQWKYIDSKSNPADDASQGVTADVYIRYDHQRKGRDFLLMPESEWQDCAQENTELNEDDPKSKESCLLFQLTK